MKIRKPARAIALFGTTAPEGKSRRLATGALSAELDNGALRYIRLDGVEVLRAIAFLVRDANWGTYAPAIRNLKLRQGRAGFDVSYEARCGTVDRGIVYRAEIAGRPDGSLRFEAVATPQADFPTNRTGFIVLHPLKGVAGRTVKVLHVDGREVTDRFPAIVNPVQPFFDVRALTHEALPGVWATCRMEGDTFETEDHRNWTDASFKTYVRPLALPWPYTLEKGKTFTQSVSLSFSGPLPKAKASKGAAKIRVNLGRGRDEMPRIGVGVPAATARASLAAAALLKQVRPQLLVAQVDQRQRHGPRELKRYGALAEAVGAELVLEIVIKGRRAPEEELGRIARDVAAAAVRPAAIQVSPAAHLKGILPGSKGPKVPSLESIYVAARAAFPGVRLGGGMFSFFTELNRLRPPAELLDYVTHTTSPIAHAADDRSVMETLEALPYVIQSTRAFIGDRAYWVGPSSIAARDNPYGAAAASNAKNERICLADMDPRHRGLFGAAWILGYVAALARGGVEAVSLGSFVGPAGLIYAPADHAQPWFDGLPGPAVYPAFHVVAGLARGAGRRQLAVASSDSSAVDGVAWRGRRGSVIWLANLTGEEQPVSLEGEVGPMTMRVLDEASFVGATTNPASFRENTHKVRNPHSLRLGPYAVACLEAAG